MVCIFLLSKYTVLQKTWQHVEYKPFSVNIKTINYKAGLHHVLKKARNTLH